MEKKRYEWLDIAKCLGVFAVVMGHTIHTTSYAKQYCDAFSVPFFFILSGLTFSCKKNTAQFLKEKVQRLLVPYSIFAVISIFIYYLMYDFVRNDLNVGNSTTNIAQNFLNAVYANSRNDGMKWNTPLWFFPTCFGALCIIYVFERLIANAAHKSLHRYIYVLVIGGVYCVFGIHIKKLYLPLQMECGLLATIYIEIGIIMKQFFYQLSEKQRIPKEKNTLLLVLILLLICGGMISMVNGKTEFHGLNFAKSILLYYGSSVIISIGLVLLSMHLSSIECLAYVRKGLAYCGKISLEIIVMHKFPIIVFQSILPVTKRIIMNPKISLFKDVVGIFLTIIVIVLCVIGEKIITKYAPWMFGKRRNNLHTVWGVSEKSK